MAPAIEEAAGCTFLAFLDIKRMPYFWQGQEQQAVSPVLELLKARQYQAVLDMVQKGEVAPRDPLPGLETSLLRRAMQKNHFSQPVVADIVILLDAVGARGEALDEGDFAAACCSGMPEVIQEFLSRGAKVTGDSLHQVVHRACINSGVSETKKSLQILLDAKAEIDGLGSMEMTPLAATTKEIGRGVVDIMRWLLDHGADPAGGKGRILPLHGLLSSWGTEDGVKLLVERRADLNQRDALGRTPIHTALSGHAKLKLAFLLKSLGADANMEDEDGMKPCDIVCRRLNQPEKAAELAGRPMNEEELRWRKAMDHHVAHMFRHSDFRRVGWTLTSPPRDRAETLGESEEEDEDEEEKEEKVQMQKIKISDLLNGRKPKTMVLTLPLTRYSEISDDLVLPYPAEGFTMQDVLMKIYEYYQAPFDEAQLKRIRQHFNQGGLGDTFGYIQDNVGGEGGQEVEDGQPANPAADAEAQPAKKRRVPRISLRGDSIYFEGFDDCKYFEDEKKLCARMALGS